MEKERNGIPTDFYVLSIVMTRKRFIRNAAPPRRPSSSTLPLYCDFGCPRAAFAPADAVGACRREQAVYCTLLKRYNNKNARCIARAR